jgi:hypothetical protein
MDDRVTEVASSYVDVWGQERAVDPAVRDALKQALGPAKTSRKAAFPKGKCYQPPFLEQGGRLWGFTVQLYSLRSARNWGIGDFTDLRALVDLSAGLGAGFIGVNPLHATSGTSPYSPSSRHALNVLYIDVEALPEFTGRRPALGDGPLVDYEAVRKAKLSNPRSAG